MKKFYFIVLLMVLVGVHLYFFLSRERSPVPDIVLPEPETATTTETISYPPLPEMIGSLLMIGHWADSPEASTTAMIEQYHLGGVIIMSAPEDPREIKSWTAAWQDVSSSTLLIAIDQEGGPVSRLRGAEFDTTGQRELATTTEAFALGKKRGAELAALGINLNFAPVLDTASSSSSFMYDRVFPNRDTSAEMAEAMVAGMNESGITGVVKHFPGHPNTSEDSHTTLPTVNSTKSELPNYAAPFFTLLRTTPPQALMTAHILFPNIDSLPVTLSPYFLTELLREELGYEGAIITDDMSMDAIDTLYSVPTASVMSVRAGADIILLAAEPSEVESVVTALVTAAEADPVLRQRIEESFTRTEALRSQLSRE